MDQKTADSLRDFAIQYPLGALLDWVKDTETGHAFLWFMGGTIVSGIGHLRSRLVNWRPAFKYGTAGAAVVCFAIATALGVSGLLANAVVPWRNGFLGGIFLSVVVAATLLIFARIVKSTNVNLVLTNTRLDPRTDPTLTYKAKVVLTFTNETGQAIAVANQESLPGKDGVNLQVPFAEGSYRYRTGRPEVESRSALVSANETFKLWIALDPRVTETEMQQRKDQRKLGTVVILPMVEGKASNRKKFSI